MNALKLRARQTIEIGKFLARISMSTQRKYVFRWLASLRKNYLINTPLPWMTFGATDFIEEHIKADWKVFEYGSGASTLFWLKHGASCVSIEHDAEWHKLVKERIPPTAAIDYRLVLPQRSDLAPANKDAFADPALCLSSDKNYKGYHFLQYVSQIDEFPDAHFDLVVVDGRARPSCVQHSIRKLKVGGLLMLDNADRKYYLEKTQPLLDNFTKYEFRGVTPGEISYTQTNIYEKLSS